MFAKDLSRRVAIFVSFFHTTFSTCAQLPEAHGNMARTTNYLEELRNNYAGGLECVHSVYGTVLIA